MSKTAKLFLKGQERELLHSSVSYHRDTWLNGKPCTELQGGVITLKFISHRDDDIFADAMLANRYDEKIKIKDHREWRRSYKLTDGKIVFYKEDGIELFQYNFKDAVIVYFQEQFDNLDSMHITMMISPAIQDYRFRSNMKWTEKSPTRFVKYAWEESYIEPKEITTVNVVQSSNNESKKDKIKITNITGPYDINTGKKVSKSISRFKDYYYEIEFNQPIKNKFDVYWGQSLDNSTKIVELKNKDGRNLRGGTLIESGKKMRIKLRFGLGENKFKIHAFLNKQKQESVSLELYYNKIVGIVKEHYQKEKTSFVELYEIEESAFVDEKSLVYDIQQDLGGIENGANTLFYDIKTPSGIMLDGIGGLGAGMEKSGGSFRITGGAKGGNVISPKYYKSAWKGGSAARITTYNMVKVGKVLGKVGAFGTIVIGSADIIINATEEKEFGEKTQEATINAVGGLVGGYIAAELGATTGAGIGAFFGGVGAVPGAIIGGIIGGVTGGVFGADALRSIGADDALKNTVNKFKD